MKKLIYNLRYNYFYYTLCTRLIYKVIIHKNIDAFHRLKKLVFNTVNSHDLACHLEYEKRLNSYIRAQRILKFKRMIGLNDNN